VRMPSLRDVDACEYVRSARIGNIDDGRPAGRPLMTDIEGRAVNPNLSATGAIQMRQQSRIGLTWHCSAPEVLTARLRETGGGSHDPDDVAFGVAAKLFEEVELLKRWFVAGDEQEKRLLVGVVRMLEP